MELITAEQPRLLTLKEAAAQARCSPLTLRRRIRAGELAAVRIGPTERSPIRIRVADLEAWLDRDPREAA